jgi:hypothetical protein
MRYKKKYNMMEHVYKAISSRAFSKDPGRNAPETSALLPLVSKYTKVMRL